MYEISTELEKIIAQSGSLGFIAVLLEGAIWVLYSSLLAVMAVVFTASPVRAQTPYHEYLAAEPSDASVMELPPLDGTPLGEPVAPEWADEEAAVEPAPEKKEEELPTPKEKEKEPSCEAEKKEEVVADYAKALIPLTIDHCGKTSRLTFVPGVRVQGRYIFDDENDNNDFLIRRFRLKGSGNAFDIARYGVELKIDNTSRFEASTPSAQVENAWLDFTLEEEWLYFRAGLYDLPFSRNALTSDSKLLFMDRSLIKEALTAIGFTDNTVGLLFHGRPFGGHLEYGVGVFDNVFFEKVGTAGTTESDELMPAGRLVWHVFDPATPPEGYADYKESYIGKGHRLEFGANAAHLGDAIIGADQFDVTAWGTDVFWCYGPFNACGEFDWFTEDGDGATVDIDGEGWFVQGGWLFCCPWELCARYQELQFDDDEELRWTSLGLNYYFREHNLKVQSDYTFRNGGDIEEDLFQVQLQLDF